MRKRLFAILLALVLALSAMSVTVLAAMNTVMLTFSPLPGQDTYSDGEAVRDGECYALVWTPDNETFRGFGEKGTAVAPCKSVKVPAAENGHCLPLAFQLGEEKMQRDYPNGKWDVYLLDTRRFETVNGKETAVDIGGKVRGWKKVGGTLAFQNGSLIEQTAVSILNFVVDDDFVFVFAVQPGNQYTTTANPERVPGGAPNALSAPTGATNGKMVLISPKAADKAFSFQVNRKTVSSTGDMRIVITIAAAYTVSVLVMALNGKKKAPAFEGGAEKKNEE